ncbi:MAG: rRNA maturation RNase YbeY [Thermodesulfobacteriota bacterium]|nr:rRNA maturation RNase YbeY [Thermodesulfobacteriota bacterium]
MEILIDNRQNKRRILEKKIKQTAKVILSALGCPDGELSILIVDDFQIEELNRSYLNRSGPTNVIAFPMREGEFSNITPRLLGDVVISLETAMREGKLAKISMEDRFDQLLIHGILHLFGYDHEKSKEEADKMGKKSNELLGVLKRC